MRQYAESHKLLNMSNRTPKSKAKKFDETRHMLFSVCVKTALGLNIAKSEEEDA